MNKFDELTDFDAFLEQQLSDSQTKAEYDALEPEFAVMQAIVRARIESGLTQKQLAERTGISQADISRLECGTANPSLKTLQRIATALDRKVLISFV